MSFLALSACSTNKVVDTFSGTPGTTGMAYCARDLWENDAIANNYPSSPIRTLENRSGTV